MGLLQRRPSANSGSALVGRVLFGGGGVADSLCCRLSLGPEGESASTPLPAPLAWSLAPSRHPGLGKVGLHALGVAMVTASLAGRS